MSTDKIIVMDRESFRKEAKTVLAVFGTTILTNMEVPTEVFKVLVDVVKTYSDGLEIALFGSKEETDDNAAETAMKEDK